MNDGELIGKVHSAMYHQCQNYFFDELLNSYKIVG